MTDNEPKFVPTGMQGSLYDTLTALNTIQHESIQKEMGFGSMGPYKVRHEINGRDGRLTHKAQHAAMTLLGLLKPPNNTCTAITKPIDPLGNNDWIESEWTSHQ